MGGQLHEANYWLDDDRVHSIVVFRDEHAAYRVLLRLQGTGIEVGFAGRDKHALWMERWAAELFEPFRNDRAACDKIYRLLKQYGRTVIDTTFRLHGAAGLISLPTSERAPPMKTTQEQRFLFDDTINYNIGVYVLCWIREYSRELGFDAQEAVEGFEALLRLLPPAPSRLESTETKRSNIAKVQDYLLVLGWCKGDRVTYGDAIETNRSIQDGEESLAR